MQGEGFSSGKANKHFNIPKGTLQRWANNAPNSSQVGIGWTKSALSELEEEMIVISLEKSA